MGIEVSIGLRFGAKTSMTTNTHTAFELLREQSIPSLKLHYQEYRHRVTGSQHIHLAADYQENVFVVALSSVPDDCTALAILLDIRDFSGSRY